MTRAFPRKTRAHWPTSAVSMLPEYPVYERRKQPQKKGVKKMRRDTRERSLEVAGPMGAQHALRPPQYASARLDTQRVAPGSVWVPYRACTIAASIAVFRTFLL